jgi:hypothetical protein
MTLLSSSYPFSPLGSSDHCPRPQQAEHAFHLSAELLSRLDVSLVWAGRLSGTSSFGEQALSPGFKDRHRLHVFRFFLFGSCIHGACPMSLTKGRL